MLVKLIPNIEKLSLLEINDLQAKIADYAKARAASVRRIRQKQTLGRNDLHPVVKL